MGPLSDDELDELASRIAPDVDGDLINPPEDVTRAAAGTPGNDQLHRADLDPGDNEFKKYWVYGEGRARWNTFTELRNHLLKHVRPDRANEIAASWFHERYGFWPGDDRNRVRQGKPPRGDRIGPG
jgi:hypothetical protein